MCITNGQGAEEIENWVNLARSVSSRLLPCFWLRREISLCKKGSAYDAVVRSILLHGFLALKSLASSRRGASTRDVVC